MQLNVHVPKDRERLLDALDRLARRLGKPKNQVVLDAIQQYVEQPVSRDRAAFDLGAFDIGVKGPLRRADIYEERLDR